MKIILGCTYIWLLVPNFHVKQAAHLHGNTAASRFRCDHVPSQYRHDTEHGHNSSPSWQFFTPNRYATSHLANSIVYRTCPTYTEQESRLRHSAILTASCYSHNKLHPAWSVASPAATQATSHLQDSHPQDSHLQDSQEWFNQEHSSQDGYNQDSHLQDSSYQEWYNQDQWPNQPNPPTHPNKHSTCCPHYHHHEDLTWKMPPRNSHLWKHTIALPNGMKVFKLAQCSQGLHIFFYRQNKYLHKLVKGTQRISSFLQSLHNNAIPPHGRPGGRRSHENSLLTHFHLHRNYLKENIDGHENRIARERSITRRPRSEAAATARRIRSNANRADHRNEYRKWKASLCLDRSQLTLDHYPSFPKRVEFSQSQQQRVRCAFSRYPNQSSRATWFQHYASPNRHHSQPQHRALSYGGRKKYYTSSQLTLKTSNPPPKCSNSFTICKNTVLISYACKKHTSPKPPPP